MKAYKEEQETAFQTKLEEELQKRLADLDQAKATVKEETTVEDLVENVEAARALGLDGAVYVGVEELKASLAASGVSAACGAV